MSVTGSKAPLRIIAADDDPSVILSLTYTLKQDGHAIRGMGDGTAVLEEIRSRPADYDLLITDHAMEGMDGLTLVKTLRKNGWKRPVVVVSAVLDGVLSSAFNRQNVRHLIRKPFDLAEIRSAIAAAAGEE